MSTRTNTLERFMYLDLADSIFFDLFRLHNVPLDCFDRNETSGFYALRSNVMDFLNDMNIKWSDNINGVNTITYMVFNRIDKVK